MDYLWIHWKKEVESVDVEMLLMKGLLINNPYFVFWRWLSLFLTRAWKCRVLDLLSPETNLLCLAFKRPSTFKTPKKLSNNMSSVNLLWCGEYVRCIIPRRDFTLLYVDVSIKLMMLIFFTTRGTSNLITFWCQKKLFFFTKKKLANSEVPDLWGSVWWLDSYIHCQLVYHCTCFCHGNIRDYKNVKDFHMNWKNRPFFWCKHYLY